MSRSRIPKPKIKGESKIIPKPNFLSLGENDDCVVFSFAALEWTEYFNLDGTCPNWSFDLFNMLKRAFKW